MCGLVSVFSYGQSGPNVDPTELLKVRDAMFRRGPDGAGLWISPDCRVGLGHRRLSILDVSDAGAQPMATPDGQVKIVFNGEIYNFHALRKTLEQKGYAFRSNCDTEVILYLYQEYGRDLVHHLRGMFAFALWDQRKQGMLLARDPFGIKPLYYADDGRTLRAASQVKALLKFAAVDRTPDPAGHVGFHVWGHVPEPYTLYKGIRALPAGAIHWVQTGGAKHLVRYFDLAGEIAQAEQSRESLTSADAQGRLSAALRDSVHSHLLSDVPIGVFLSSGIDSTSIAALARSAGHQVRTVTLGFHEFRQTKNDEVPLAERFAQEIGTDHQSRWVTADEFAIEYDRLLEAMDQPSIDGINSYFVSKVAAQCGLKVALSGIGGDELFAGYPSFAQIPLLVSLAKPFQRVPVLGKLMRRLVARNSGRLLPPKYAGVLEYGGSYPGAYLLRRGLIMPWELEQKLEPEMAREGWQELQALCCLAGTIKNVKQDQAKIMALETNWYMRNQLLRDIDWASMAHSLEVRTPFVDIDVFRATLPLLCSDFPPTKDMLCAVPSPALPDYIRLRKKTGFSIPTRTWLSRGRPKQGRGNGIREWADEIYKPLAAADQERPVASSESVLIFRVGQLGDTLVALPVIKGIREKYKNQRLVLLTDKHPTQPGYVSSWEVLGPTGWFDKVIYYDPTNLTGFRTLQLANALRREHIGTAYCLTPTRTARQNCRDYVFFKYLAGIPKVIVGRTVAKAASIAGLHKTQELAEWKELAIKADFRELLQVKDFVLPISSIDKGKAIQQLRDIGFDGADMVVAVGPGSKMPAKRWSTERYAQWGRRSLDQFPGLRMVILGGAEDRKIGDYLVSHWGDRAANMAGKLTIYESAAMLQRCALYVGNDTGTMHLMAMVGGRCLALFSARDVPGKWDPYGDRHTVIRRNVDCAGCMKVVCPHDNKCMELIEVDEVFRQTTRALTLETQGGYVH